VCGVKDLILSKFADGRAARCMLFVRGIASVAQSSAQALDAKVLSIFTTLSCRIRSEPRSGRCFCR
jgi:hypothetical protein